MRQKQRNSKRTKKKDAKILRQGVFTRLDEPVDSSKDKKIKAGKNSESFLPSLKASVNFKEVNGNSNQARFVSTDIVGSLPLLGQQGQKLKPTRKTILKEDVLNESGCNGELKRNFPRFNFSTSTTATQKGNCSNKNLSEVYFQKQRKAVTSEELIDKGLNSVVKCKGTECRRRPRQFNQIEAKSYLTCGNTQKIGRSIYDKRHHENDPVCRNSNETTKQPKQVNQHLTPITANGSSKENIPTTSSARAERFHVKTTKSKNKFQSPLIENPLSEAECPDLGLNEELDFQVESAIFEASFEYCSVRANQDLFKIRVNEKVKDAKPIDNSIVNIIENKEPMNSPESKSSGCVRNHDRGFCEQDVICEEIIHDANHSQRMRKGKAIAVAQGKPSVCSFTKRVEKLNYKRDRGSVLSTNEFQVVGLEVTLKEMPMLKKKTKNVSMSFPKPKISRYKDQGKNVCNLQGHKVKGCSVDIDEYIISMVRFFNCNDKSTKEDLRGFIGRPFLWSP